ncbi:MAG: hypothetical protein ACRDIV_20325 [Ktedonobacteraceae bacterium]
MFSRRSMGCLIIAVIVVLVLIFAGRPLVSRRIADQMYPYTSLDNDPIIARLIVHTTGTSIKWNVQLFTYDSSGKPIDHSPSYPENCDQWALKADVINIQSWLATSVPSGWYILTALVGTHCLNTHGIIDASIVERIPIDRNTGPVTQDGAFGNLVSLKSLTSNSIGPDSKTYNAIITLTSLSLVAEN